jgi:hypothetical protein
VAHAYLARGAPVRAVRREGDVGAVVQEPPGDDERGAAGEHVVLRLQHLPRGGRRGHDDDRHLAEADEHDGAVRRGECMQRAVREAAELVEVADEREPPRGGRRAVGIRNRWRRVHCGYVRHLSSYISVVLVHRKDTFCHLLYLCSLPANQLARAARSFGHSQWVFHGYVTDASIF